MAYIQQDGVIIDAVLSRIARQKLAKGEPLNITQFALGDTEVDYSLWNPDHPNGTAYYGATIEAMPVTEAVPDETQNLKYKLVTLPRKTIRIPKVSVPQTSVTLSAGQSITITPQTINYTLGNSTFGYKFTLADSDVCSVYISESAPGQVYAGQGSSIPQMMSQNEYAQSVTVVGKEIVLTANLLQIAAKSTTLTIEGIETGGSVTVNITVQKVTTATTPNAPLTGNAPISLT